MSSLASSAPIKATEDRVKLFPRDCQHFVDALQQKPAAGHRKTHGSVDLRRRRFRTRWAKSGSWRTRWSAPLTRRVWEGQPNELKLKYLADNDFANLSGDELTAAIKDSISHKEADLKGTMASQGTTPRRLTDLIGSLCDLTSGSGDKGTPII